MKTLPQTNTGGFDSEAQCLASKCEWIPEPNLQQWAKHPITTDRRVYWQHHIHKNMNRNVHSSIAVLGNCQMSPNPGGINKVWHLYNSTTEVCITDIYYNIGELWRYFSRKKPDTCTVLAIRTSEVSFHTCFRLWLQICRKWNDCDFYISFSLTSSRT